MITVKNQMAIINIFTGFVAGIFVMMIVGSSEQVVEIERDVIPTFLIQENINTCEDIIEWMNEDVKMYADSTVFDTYIWNLEQMIEDNRNLIAKDK